MKHRNHVPYSSRALTSAADSSSSAARAVRDATLRGFGVTPFLGTYPDFVAGAAAMVPALFVAAGFEVSVLHFFI